MNVEELRDYCLSLGADVEEKMPFQAFKAARGVLAFYVGGHMFCYFDVDRFEVVTVKCQPERIEELKERQPAVGNPYNMSPRHWIGIDPVRCPAALLRELVGNSYLLVRGGVPPCAAMPSELRGSTPLQFAHRDALRRWLARHHATEQECWVVTYRSKAAPSYPAVPYAEVVEEALCFGWIDSSIRRLPDGRVVQRLSPRRKNSRWSRLNIERFRDLQRRGLVAPAGLLAFEQRKTVNDET